MTLVQGVAPLGALQRRSNGALCQGGARRGNSPRGARHLRLLPQHRARRHRASEGMAVQLEPMKPVLKAPGSTLWNLRYEWTPFELYFQCQLAPL